MPDLPAADADNYDEAIAVRAGAMTLAVQVLWALSGRQFGVCGRKARPCPQMQVMRRSLSYGSSGYGSPFVPIWDSGGWRNVSCGCLGSCSYNNPRVVHLPGPVQEIREVIIGATVLDEAEYVLEGNVLYRRDHDWPWQNLALPAGEPGTWTVEFTNGLPVPAGVDRLTGKLAGEFAQACSGSKCRLPRNVVAANRQGVSYQVYDPNLMYKDGKTGLAEVDMWLSAVNPRHLMAAPQVI